MKIALLVFVASCGRIAFDPVPDAASTAASWPTLDGRWAWMSGSQLQAAPVVYPESGTSYRGAVDNGGFWSVGDQFWQFGGLTPVGATNDVWRYDSTTNEWSFVRGSRAPGDLGSFGTKTVEAASNEPGARNDPSSWVASDGTLWMFGGSSSGIANYRSDIWRFDPTSQLWTWMGGAQTLGIAPTYGAKGLPSGGPGGRDAPMVWGDESGVWLFGGEANPSPGVSDQRSDLWHWDRQADAWTWVSGPSTSFATATRGTRGVPSASTQPGVEGMCAFGDPANGALFLIDSQAAAWKYDIAMGQWTWLGGPTTDGQAAQHGVPRTPSDSVSPGGLLAANCWVDLLGHAWVQGGTPGDASTNVSTDLWVFLPESNQWAFVVGAAAANGRSLFGVQGVPTEGIWPGARLEGSRFVASDGSLWLYGGDFAYDVNGVQGIMGDMWRFSRPD